MTLPNFLIIGAMKAGTTSLSDALALHPEAFIPASKEPNSLVDTAVLETDGLARYEALFARSDRATARGEASTGYTKRHLGGASAAENALAVLGPDLRLIFLVRDPIERAASHARHLLMSGRPYDVAVDLEASDPVCELGCYAYQIEPWVEAFGTDNLLVIDMSDLTKDWPRVSKVVCEHLGIEPTRMPAALGQSNASADARPARGVVSAILGSRIYQKVVQERIPMQLRRSIRRLVLRRAPVPDISASTMLVADSALERWQEERASFEDLTGVWFLSAELDRRLAERGLSTG